MNDIVRRSSTGGSSKDSLQKWSRFFLRVRLQMRRCTLWRSQVFSGFTFNLPPAYALRLSLVGATLFGIVFAATIDRILGSNALARETENNLLEVIREAPPLVLGESDSIDEGERFVREVVEDIEAVRKTDEKDRFEEKIREMTRGYPIEDMAALIAEKDRTIAIFLVAIAKKESAWGKRVPLFKEHDCFNYWGYRGKRRFMGTGGHTCFNSPKDAVDTVARRIEKIVYVEKQDTPAEMMSVWKCGYDCSAHSKESTRKWIQDVDLYFHRLDMEDEE